MTAKEKFLAVHADARCVEVPEGEFEITYGDDPTLPGYANLVGTADSEEAAWQNAAESLPAQPEQETPVAGGLSHEEHRRACMFNLPAAVFGTSPKVAPVEAKEEKWLKCPYCGRLSEGGKYHEQQCEAPAEPKPTPSTLEPAITDKQMCLLSRKFHEDNYTQVNDYIAINDWLTWNIERIRSQRG